MTKNTDLKPVYIFNKVVMILKREVSTTKILTIDNLYVLIPIPFRGGAVALGFGKILEFKNKNEYKFCNWDREHIRVGKYAVAYHLL